MYNIIGIYLVRTGDGPHYVNNVSVAGGRYCMRLCVNDDLVTVSVCVFVRAVN